MITNGYTSLTAVRSELGIGDADDDAKIELAIGAASRQIDNYCGRRFWQDSSVVAREFFAHELDDLPDISTATGLIVGLDLSDTGTYGQTLTVGTDFLLRPVNAADMVPVWPYTQIVMTGQTYTPLRSSYGRPTVQVTAKWGWPAVPDDVQKACVIQAVQLAKAKEAAFGVAALAGIDGVGMRASPWNPLARDLISPYQKPAVG